MRNSLVGVVAALLMLNPLTSFAATQEELHAQYVATLQQLISLLQNQVEVLIGQLALKLDANTDAIRDIKKDMANKQSKGKQLEAELATGGEEVKISDLSTKEIRQSLKLGPVIFYAKINKAENRIEFSFTDFIKGDDATLNVSKGKLVEGKIIEDGIVEWGEDHGEGNCNGKINGSNFLLCGHYPTAILPEDAEYVIIEVSHNGLSRTLVMKVVDGSKATEQWMY